MKTDIFIVTHSRHLPWLRLCLQSIRKFASGFHRVVIVVPMAECGAFNLIQDFDSRISLCTFRQSDPPLSHLHHCYVKCTANEFDCTADYFLYIDSDCVFREPVAPEDYFVGDKPVLLCEAYESIIRKKMPEICWRDGTSKTLGFVPTHECMRRHPAVHSSDVLKKFRQHVEAVHHMNMLDYALAQRPDFPVGFNDFNNLGAYAHRFHPDQYHLIDLTDHPELRPHDKLVQYWSHGDPTRPQKRWLDGKEQEVIPVLEIRTFLC